MRRFAGLIIGLVGVVVASKVLVEDVLGIPLESTIQAWLAGAGPGSAAMIVALLAVDVFLPVPSSLIMVLSGAAFGVLWGTCLSLAGSVAGEWVGFELVRAWGRRVTSRFVGDDDVRRFNRFFDEYGAAAIVMTRPIPVIMETMSMVAGLSGMSRTAFLAASLIGTAPVAMLYGYAGAVSRATGTVLPAAIILVSVAAAGYGWYRVKLAPSGRVSPRSPSSAASPDSRPAGPTPSPGSRW
jgi:uncharacterized membrane protein YdjX (TVP38/TMEM64 family)